MRLCRPVTRRNRSGFTLVELLTVVGIIAMLIAILLPSLARARNQTKKVKTAGVFSGIDKSLEMFRNDFRDYPDSSRGYDPIFYDLTQAQGGMLLETQDKADPTGQVMSGAHWLARALAGHDRMGMDAAGRVMVHRLADSSPPAGDPFRESVLKAADRKGVYMEGGDLFARDADLRNSGSFKATGRPVVVDAFDFPVLYYRANPRARQAFTFRAPGDVQGVPADVPGIYNHYDNALITGSASLNTTGWDFAGVGQHRMGVFGGMSIDPNSDDFIEKSDFKGSFTERLHNHNAHESGNVIKPQNGETFILISAGPDGNYGTDDDVTNFKGAL